MYISTILSNLLIMLTANGNSKFKSSENKTNKKKTIESHFILIQFKNLYLFNLVDELLRKPSFLL